MIINDPITYKALLKKIEKVFNRGSGENWTNLDFNRLSDRIFHKTGERLSITTLKRIWGRTNTKTRPSLTTLNILSAFAEDKDWREFEREYRQSRPENAKKNRIRVFTKKRILLVATIVVTVFSLLYGFSGSEGDAESLHYAPTDRIVFEVQKIASGYPNTVKFEYDVGDISFDSLFIQQSWDRTKRIPLEKRNGLVTTTYYYPGYFLARLVVDNAIVREQELYIPTKGWQGIAINDSDFSYLKPGHIVLDNTLTFKPNTIELLNNEKGAELFLANLVERPFINGSDFSLETDFRMPIATESSICRNIRMTITDSKEVLSFQFGIPGCVGDLMFYINKEMVSGRKNDLSAFGIETDKWTNCKVRVRDNRVTVFLNGQSVYKHLLRSDIGKIGGVQWIFQGIGEIQKLRISDSEERFDMLDKRFNINF